MQPSPLIFIASPVSAPTAGEMQQRIDAAAQFGAWLQEHEGKCPFVAAAHDKALAKFLSQPKTQEWWQANIGHFLAGAESCYVLCLPGWENSRGVAFEIEMARAFNKPVYYYELTADGYQRLSP